MPTLRTIEELDAAHPVPDALAVLDDFAGFAARARAGDATAMLAIGRMLQGCSSFEPTTVVLPNGVIESYSKRCGNVPPQERVPAWVWLERAAAAGDPRAMVEFALAVTAPFVPTDATTRVKAYRFLVAAAQAGVADAWLALVEASRSGRYAALDPVEAAAWLLAMDQLAPGAMAAHGGAALIEPLTPAGRTAAHVRAGRIVEAMKKGAA